MLPDPTFSEPDPDGTFTDQWYELLPAFMRNLDTGQQLYRFMQLLGAKGDDVMTIATDADEGRLTDPHEVPEALLPWLAQMAGVSSAAPTRADLVRSRLADLQAVSTPGSAPAIAAAVRPLLVDTQWVAIVPHYEGDPWTIGVMVRTAEAPADLGTIAAAIVDAGEKPAGWALEVVGVAASWSAFDALGATWAEADAAGGTTWQDEEKATWS